MTTLGGIVLCGGESRRMGRPKAWLPFGPERMLQRVVRLMAPAVGPIVVVAASGQDIPSLPGSIRVIRDPVADRGPLQGIAAGLEALPDDVELAYATATDVPFLNPAWVTHLAYQIGDHDIAIPEVDAYLHPLAAIYRRRAVLDVVVRLLDQGRLRPVFLLEELKTLRLGREELIEVDPELATLRNLNHPEEYRQALADSGFLEKTPTGIWHDSGTLDFVGRGELQSQGRPSGRFVRRPPAHPDPRPILGSGLWARLAGCLWRHREI